MKSYDYAGALKQYDEGFANGQNIYNGTEPEYKEAVELRSQAFTKNKRLNELIPWVRKAAEDKEYMTVDALQNTLKTADEAIALQPNNEQLKKWREQIVARAEKTKADNDRTAAGRKYLDTARSEENTYLSQVSYVQSQSGQWGENVEVDMQSHIQKAIDNYRESLKYIPDAAVEKKIKELEATLEGRKKYLENYRLSVTLKNEADALYRQATQDPDIQSASPKYDEAAEKYRKSLSLYRPFNAENVEKTIYVLEYYKHERWVKKYWADGQALEKENKIVDAVAAYDKAIASFHPTVPQMDRMWIISPAQDLRNRITGAKNWRADGEAKQKAGKIPEAIASYKQSLALLPDAALAEHVRMLEGKQAEVGEKKATADKLWQEGTALFNQGRPSDALTKFKESLGYWSDATRTKYVADMEARRAKAVALREEGAKLQQGNRIPEAIAKYKESLSYWPDSGLSSHIATLEGKLKQDSDTAARKVRAKQLRDEGYALQQKNQLQAAVGKYKESLAILPDKQLEDYIRQLEAKIAAVPPVVQAAAGYYPGHGIFRRDLQRDRVGCLHRDSPVHRERDVRDGDSQREVRPGCLPGDPFRHHRSADGRDLDEAGGRCDGNAFPGRAEGPNPGLFGKRRLARAKPVRQPHGNLAGEPRLKFANADNSRRGRRSDSGHQYCRPLEVGSHGRRKSQRCELHHLQPRRFLHHGRERGTTGRRGRLHRPGQLHPLGANPQPEAAGQPVQIQRRDDAKRARRQIRHDIGSRERQRPLLHVPARRECVGALHEAVEGRLDFHSLGWGDVSFPGSRLIGDAGRLSSFAIVCKAMKMSRCMLSWCKGGVSCAFSEFS